MTTPRPTQSGDDGPPADLESILSGGASLDEITLRLFRLNHAAVSRTDPELAEMMRACAIPHRFDETIIGVLRGAPGGRQKNRRLLEKLKGFSFVQQRKDGHFVYHDNTRDVLLKDWRAGRNRKQYAEYRRRLFAHYTACGDEHFGRGEYAEALADFNRAVDLRRADAELHHRIGETHLQLQDYRAVVLDYTRALRHAPKNGMY